MYHIWKEVIPMALSEIRQKVRQLVAAYGPFAAREWIFANLSPGIQQATAIAELCSMTA
jgi:energy-coupling factor transporter ATP-binding protein EcfA2